LIKFITVIFFSVLSDRRFALRHVGRVEVWGYGS